MYSYLDITYLFDFSLFITFGIKVRNGCNIKLNAKRACHFIATQINWIFSFSQKNVKACRKFISWSMKKKRPLPRPMPEKSPMSLIKNKEARKWYVKLSKSNIGFWGPWHSTRSACSFYSFSSFFCGSLESLNLYLDGETFLGPRKWLVTYSVAMANFRKKCKSLSLHAKSFQ